LTEQKDILRQEAIKHRSRMHQDIEDPEKVVGLFFDHISLPEGAVVAGYHAKGREFDPYPILEELHKRGFTCALPLIKEGTKQLSFGAWDTRSDLRVGAFDIMEPVVDSEAELVLPDIVIVPLLAFDRKGHRLGYGGGYYDTTLAYLRSHKEVTAVGLAYAQQACLFNLPAEEHDQSLDWVITPQEAHNFMS